MKRVLIVDDDEDLLEMVDHIVRSHDLATKCINTGAAVMGNLEDQSFDLILMDVFLGDSDGRQLSYQIKHDPRFMHIPIILYSAATLDPGLLEQSLAEEFLQKPFDMHDLIERINNLLSQKRA